jgi:hypothetical protein
MLYSGGVIAGYALGAIAAVGLLSLFICVCIKNKMANRGRVLNSGVTKIGVMGKSRPF